MKITLFFGIIILISFGLLGYLHENVHQVILSNYGINSSIEIMWKSGDLATTYYENPDDIKCNESCLAQNSMNEVVGYHLQAFFLLIAIGLIIIIGILEQSALMFKELVESKDEQ